MSSLTNAGSFFNGPGGLAGAGGSYNAFGIVGSTINADTLTGGTSVTSQIGEAVQNGPVSTFGGLFQSDPTSTMGQLWQSLTGDSGSIASTAGGLALNNVASATAAVAPVSSISDLFLRGVIIILGFIFVAVGLNMFNKGR